MLSFPSEKLDTNEDDDETMEENGMTVTRVDEQRLLERSVRKAAKRTRVEVDEDDQEDNNGQIEGDSSEDEMGGNKKGVNRMRKLQAKKARKAAKRMAQGKMGSDGEGSQNGDDSYDFDNLVAM